MPRAEETPPLVAKFRVGDQSDTTILPLFRGAGGITSDAEVPLLALADPLPRTC